MTDPAPMSDAELTKFGAGMIAYMRAVYSDEARILLPNVKGIPADEEYIGIFDADGGLLAITDSQDAAMGYLYRKKITARWVI